MSYIKQTLDEHPFFPKRTLFTSACGFLFGLLISRELIGKPAYALLLGMLSLGLVLAAFRFRALPLVLIACALGMLRLQIAYPTLPRPTEHCDISGVIAQTPVKTEHGWSVTLSGAVIDDKPLEGLALLYLPESIDYVPAYAHHISTSASITLPQGARNIGGMDMRFYYLSKGIVCIASANGGTLEYTAWSEGLYGKLLALKQSATLTLISHMGKENGALAAGMLHGDTLAVPDGALEDFRAAGIAHLLAVSGLHVSLLAGVLMFILRRAPLRVQAALAALFLLLYSMLTAFSASTVRASLMMLSLLLGRVLFRRNDPLTSLALSFLIITLISPFQVFALGFQLSFTAVLGILLVYPRVKAALKRLPEALADAIAISLSAQAATLPVMAAAFHNLPLLGLFANILTVPLAPLVILPAGMALLLNPLSAGAAGFFAGISDVTLRLMRSAASLFASGGALTIPSAGFFAGLSFFALLLFASNQCLLKGAIRRIAPCAIAAVCLVFWALPRLSMPKEYVAVLDTYYGYAVHVRQNGQDRLVTSTGDIEIRAVRAYISGAGISAYTLEKGEREGITLWIYDIPINIRPGYVQAGGALYAAKDTGQLTLCPTREGLTLRPYARDYIYDILLEK